MVSHTEYRHKISVPALILAVIFAFGATSFSGAVHAANGVNVSNNPVNNDPIFDGDGLVGGLGQAESELTGTGIRADQDLVPAIANVINFLLGFVEIFAILAFVVAGFYFILGFGSDSAIQRARKILIWAAVGIIVIEFSKVLVDFVINASTATGDTSVNVRGDADIEGAIIGVINFLLGFVALAAVTAFIISGFTFILGFGSDSSVQRARKIMIWSAIGIVVVGFSYVITDFIIDAVTSTGGNGASPVPTGPTF